MSVLIKGLRLPPEDEFQSIRKNRLEIVIWADGSTLAKEIWHDGAAFVNMPALEIPTPHGRLIDADRLSDDIEDRLPRAIQNSADMQYATGLSKALLALRAADTIIEAEFNDRESVACFIKHLTEGDDGKA